MDFLKKNIEWIPVILIAIIFGGSFPFKFTDAPITVHIFNVVGDWIGLEFFKSVGGYLIGVAEAVAILLIVFPKTRGLGGLLAVGIMSGAIIFHLFSPLGATVRWEEGGQMMEDGTLFYTAVLVWFSGLFLFLRNKDQVLGLIGMGGDSAGNA